jgi:hypothetical protein
MREWLRVVASDKNTYQLRFFNVEDVRSLASPSLPLIEMICRTMRMRTRTLDWLWARRHQGCRVAGWLEHYVSGVGSAEKGSSFATRRLPELCRRLYMRPLERLSIRRLSWRQPTSAAATAVAQSLRRLS